MTQDYTYSYEWDQEYCYPKSNVLRNKLNIQGAKELLVAEREITALRLANAKAKPITGTFDLKHLQHIHGYLFQDIYSWAGQLRHVNISKGNMFCLAMNLESYANSIFAALAKENYLIGSSGNIPLRLAYYFSEINVLHPFREGNGRTQRVFIQYLAAVAGYNLDFTSVSAREMIVASSNSFACDYEKFNALFTRISSPISKTDQIRYIRLFFGKKASSLVKLLT